MISNKEYEKINNLCELIKEKLPKNYSNGHHHVSILFNKSLKGYYIFRR